MYSAGTPDRSFWPGLCVAQQLDRTCDCPEQVFKVPVTHVSSSRGASAYDEALEGPHVQEPEAPGRRRVPQMRGLSRCHMTEIDVRAFDEYGGGRLGARCGPRYERFWSLDHQSGHRRAARRCPGRGWYASARRRYGHGRSRRDGGGRGADATGVDVASAMVEIRRRHPAVAFVQASVTALPFADGSFDGAVGNIMIQHVGEPERAARACASARAGRTRGAVDVDLPERSPFFAALLGAIAEAEVPPPSEMPSGPSPSSSRTTPPSTRCYRARALPMSRSTRFHLPVQSADDLIAALSDGTVRTERCARLTIHNGAGSEKVSKLGLRLAPARDLRRACVGQDRQRNAPAYTAMTTWPTAWCPSMWPTAVGASPSG